MSYCKKIRTAWLSRVKKTSPRWDFGVLNFIDRIATNFRAVTRLQNLPGGNALATVVSEFGGGLIYNIFGGVSHQITKPKLL